MVYLRDHRELTNAYPRFCSGELLTSDVSTLVPKTKILTGGLSAVNLFGMRSLPTLLSSPQIGLQQRRTGQSNKKRPAVADTTYLVIPTKTRANVQIFCVDGLTDLEPLEEGNLSGNF